MTAWQSIKPLLLTVLFLIGAVIVFAPPLNSASHPHNHTIKVKSVRINFNLANADQTRFGKLEWRGGIEIVGLNKNFGGLSGIAIAADGSRFIAVSDEGMWVSGDIEYEEGRLTNVANVKIAPLLDRRGRAFVGKNATDAESVATYDAKGLDGDLLVAFERNQRIGRYNFGEKGVGAREKIITLPVEAKRMRGNKEFESVGRYPRGSRLEKTIIVISERFLDDAGNIIGWLIGGPTPGRFTVKRIDDFDITDLTITPDNELIILERYFSVFSGVKMRLRKIKSAGIKPGAVLDGEVLLKTDQKYTIDNMEGLASHRTADGEVRLTLISDDNFNAFQRTLLMQFALPK